jgi:uncharacterized protein (DUF2252 family)
MRDPVAEFQEFNRPFARRNAELLRLKIGRMAANPFTFFRGTFHLFARDMIEHVFASPAIRTGSEIEMDLVGDIHSENFGTYKGDDGAVHYDVNDFDETTRGRFDFDVFRHATSLLLAAQERSAPLTLAVPVVLAFLETYTQSVVRLVKKGRDLDLDLNESNSSAYPPVQSLLKEAASTKRPAFINKLTTFKDGHRTLTRSVHYFNLPEEEKAQAVRLLEDYRKRMAEPPASDFYAVEDVCGRVSGIGSMGRYRYAVLINGKGTRDGQNLLIEFKESRPSAYDLYRNRQTDAASLLKRAEQVITVQRASQAVSNARLGFAIDGPLSFQVRELGPRDARIDIKGLKSDADVQSVARAQAALLARIHARSASRAVGVTNPLAELNDVDAFCQRVLAFALAYADLARSDWTQFIGRRTELENCEQWAGK